MKKRVINRIRILLLAVFLIAITFQAYRHNVLGGGPEGAASIHALCPYGGLESLYALVTEGSPVDKIYAGTISLFIISIILAIVFRRGFCGWICPFGALQEFLGMFGRKVFGKQFKVHEKIDSVLRYLKYLVLVLTAVMAWLTASLWVSPYDPWAAYGHLVEGISAVWAEFPVGLILLCITIIGSFFYDRFFCKYLCPMGAFLGITSKLGITVIKRDVDLCINCSACSKACPVNIDVEHVNVVSSAECLNCQQCVESCPKKGALENSVTILSNVKLKPVIVGAMVLVIYFGGIGVSVLFGSTSFLPGPISGNDLTINDPEELKGYMTLSDIADVTGIQLEVVYEKMGVPMDIPNDVPAKEIKDILPEFDFHSAKEQLFE